MTRNILLVPAFCLLAASVGLQSCAERKPGANASVKEAEINAQTDNAPPTEVMDVINTVIHSSNTFDIEAVANLYTPNAVVADDEPPYSWNGPTAGVQWVNAIEKVCRDSSLTKLKGSIGSINVFQQTADNFYIVVPVTYTGYLPGRPDFSSKGAFTFVLRIVNGKWLIKSQVWMPKRGI